MRRCARSSRAHQGRRRVPGRMAGADTPLKLTQPPGPIVTAPTAGRLRRPATATPATANTVATPAAASVSVRIHRRVEAHTIRTDREHTDQPAGTGTDDLGRNNRGRG
jgi:hypothetical protein